jgi:single-strand DNA-binding protein
MSSLNRVTLIGRAGRDPEARTLTNGETAVSLHLATSDRWRDKQSGEQKEATEWHRIVAFGKLAEIIEQYVIKGQLIYVEGKLKTRKWQDKDGKDVYTTEINASDMKMLSPGRQQEGQSRDANNSPAPQRQQPLQQRAAAPAQQRAPAGGGGFGDDDIPFNRLPSTYAI